MACRPHATLRPTQPASKSTRAATLAGQHTLYDLNLFNQWLNAYKADTADLAQIYENRFRPEFRPAFEAWLATDPFNNPDAPPGPLYMPEYVLKEAEEAQALEAEAAQLAAQGDQTRANALLIQATRTATEAGQHTLYDLTMFNQWLNAHAAETADLTALYERRFRPEFWYAFEAWLATDPFNNPDAPPGPLYMPEYSVSEGEEARRLDAEAARLAAEGEAANEVSDKYVLNTVFLAACLFFIAIGERFEWAPVRIAILVMAAAMLIYGVYHLAIYPIE